MTESLKCLKRRWRRQLTTAHVSTK